MYNTLEVICMNYSCYKKSRDLSWKILIENHVTQLPIKVSRICNQFGLKIINYDKGAEAIKYLQYEDICKESDGFIFNDTIFYNNHCTIQRQRFTISHELGHYLLHGGKGFYNRQPFPNTIPFEQEANVLASRLLAPSCVLWGVGVTKPEEIALLCDISLEAAQYRMNHMTQLYERERYFKQVYGKSYFLQSPLEKQVYQLFEPYIHELKRYS
ncbi:MAG: ImmA/IrrE family metallo-endopeptidase [Bacteroidales bacterium]